MVLALGFCILKQRTFIKTPRMHENWSSNLDCVVECEYADGLAWRIKKLGKSTSKLRTGSTLNIFEELAHDTVE